LRFISLNYKRHVLQQIEERFGLPCYIEAAPELHAGHYVIDRAPEGLIDWKPAQAVISPESGFVTEVEETEPEVEETEAEEEISNSSAEERPEVHRGATTSAAKVAMARVAVAADAAAVAAGVAMSAANVAIARRRTRYEPRWIIMSLPSALNRAAKATSSFQRSHCRASERRCRGTRSQAPAPGSQGRAAQSAARARRIGSWRIGSWRIGSQCRRAARQWRVQRI